MSPFVLFNVQFVFCLVAYALIAIWYVAPRLAGMSREMALVPLLWVHVFRIIGGTILAPGSVEAAVPADFQAMIGYGDMLAGLFALIVIVALRVRFAGAIALARVFLIYATLDTANAFIQSLRDNVFVYVLGLNWTIVTIYVPALLVSSVLILLQLLRRDVMTAAW
jgi:hypothetical protein